MIQNEPLVSVIMATYNCEDTLNEAVDSIINQTYTNWEFIICDDCSNDNTFNILLEYQNKYPHKIKIIKNEINSKLSFSLNRCLEISSGKYIARMDADDISVLSRFEKQVTFLNSNQEFMVVGSSFQRFDGIKQNKVIKMDKIPNEKSLLTSVPFCHATIMMRKEAYDKLSGYTVSHRTVRGQDRDLWFRFFAKGYKGANMQEVLYFVRENPDAIKRRTFISRWNNMRTSLYGYKLLNFKIRHYPLAFVPVLKALVPHKVLVYKHNKIKKNKIK